MDIPVRKSTNAKSKLIIAAEMRPALTQWAALTASAMSDSLEMELNAFVIQTNATKITVAVENMQFATTHVDHSSVCVTTDTLWLATNVRPLANV